MDKLVKSAEVAVCDINDGDSLAVGGFGLCGIPSTLIAALLLKGVGRLSVVSNNCCVDDWGLGLLLGAGRISRMTSSYVGETTEFARQYLEGDLEVGLTPQGTLAERLRAGGAGIAGFYTQTGVGTQVADGGLPWKYGPDGNVSVTSPNKEVRQLTFRNEVSDFVFEEAIACDFGIVHALKGDRHGNLVFNKSARNFNPLCAMAGRLTIAEVEELFEPGELDPDEIHLPGIYVDRVVELTVEEAAAKRIERRTLVKS